MNERASFYRKIAYGVAIAILLFPLAWLSSPATIKSPGGELAQLREEYKLGQSNLGEIDPASETIKLATLGMRGIAVNLLWEKANYYKKTENWTELTATLEQLAKLQPNFITFWMFQSWNLTYNVSVEFDDYRDRYYYVRRGIEFLKQGERYNKDHPKILKELGWFIGNKIGTADEKVQYRKLFKEDDEFHPEDRRLEDRDNWLVGKEWYNRAVYAADELGKGIGRTSGRIFYAYPAKAQMSYAEAIGDDGFFEKAAEAWATAEEEWNEFGDRVILHSTGVQLQLNNDKKLEDEVERLQKELDALGPEVKDELAAEKHKNLPNEMRKALDAEPEKRTVRQQELLYEAEQRVAVTPGEVAERIAEKHPEKSRQARQLASELATTERDLTYTKNYKRDSNFDYWKTRAEFEQTPDAREARRLIFQAKQAFRDEANPEKAKELFERSFVHWRKVFDAYPSLLNDDATTPGDVLFLMKDYKTVLDQLDESIPDDFPLWVLIEQFDTEQDFKEELQEYQERTGKTSDNQNPEGDATDSAEPTDPTDETMSDADTSSEESGDGTPDEEEASTSEKD